MPAESFFDEKRPFGEKYEVKDTDSLLEKFILYIAKRNMLMDGDRTLLAVSGGMDSTVMARLFAEAGLPFAIAHCNFGLRGKQSDDDEQFVRRLAAGYQTEVFDQKFETLEYARQHRLSIQEAARNLRYEWFEEIARENNFKKIATAHHVNDSIETFFINLMRGTGPAGLRGIQAVNGKIIRPLLFATRDEIDTFARAKDIEYREDSSNDSDAYLRNRIRHYVIPAMKQIEPDLEIRMTGLFDQFSFLHDYSTKALEEWKEKFEQVDDNGEIRIPLAEISRQPDPRAFLSFLLYSHQITGADSGKILESEQSGKVIHASQKVILRDRGHLIIRSLRETGNDPAMVTQLPSLLSLGRQKIRLTMADTREEAVTFHKHLQQVDADKAALPLIIRRWEKGDAFYPLGMTGTKKVSDYYVDQKLNRFEKEETYLLLSGTDIVCILGHRIDDRFKVTPYTRKILTIEFSTQ
jgi:tRNA(Ile)-lysidine synthase